jgi:hypothetical protein
MVCAIPRTNNPAAHDPDPDPDPYLPDHHADPHHPHTVPNLMTTK